MTDQVAIARIIFPDRFGYLEVIGLLVDAIALGKIAIGYAIFWVEVY